MTNDKYLQQLELAKKRGLFMDPRVERRCVNGVCGFYANAFIPKNTKLVSYPKKKCIKPFENVSYSENTPITFKNIHRALKEYLKGDSSEFYCHFMQLEPLSVLKEISTYFFSDEELQFIESMNPMLLNSIKLFNMATQSRVDFIKQLEPDVDEDIIAFICLNYASRAWDDSNFLPMIDYANHSDRKGNPRTASKNDFLLVSKVDYQAGDQVFLTYSRRDMYFHCINYNYFDPEGAHSIIFGYRFGQIAATDRDKLIYQLTASRFAVSSGMDANKNIQYRCADNDVCFLENAPSLKLLKYLETNYLPTDEELKAKRANLSSLHSRLLMLLQFMQNDNKIDQFKLKDVPPKLHRFYHLLKKEKSMLEKNTEWLLDSSYQ